MYIGTFIGIFVSNQNDTILNSDFRRAAFGMLAISYPIILFVIGGFMQWREQGYMELKVIFDSAHLKMEQNHGSRFIIASMVITCTLLTVFITIVCVALDWKLGLGILIGIGLICYFIYIFVAWKNAGFYLDKEKRILVVSFLIGVTGMGIFLAVTQKTTYFMGLSISWLAVSLLILFSTVAQFMQAKNQGNAQPNIHLSNTIFPVFIYDECTNDITSFNNPIIFAFISLCFIACY